MSGRRLRLSPANLPAIRDGLARRQREALAGQDWGPWFREAMERAWGAADSVRIGLNYEDEPRYIVTGVVDGKHWSAICTDRGGRVRIISFRRAHKKEEEIYEDSNS